MLMIEAMAAWQHGGQWVCSDWTKNPAALALSGLSYRPLKKCVCSAAVSVSYRVWEISLSFMRLPLYFSINSHELDIVLGACRKYRVQRVKLHSFSRPLSAHQSHVGLARAVTHAHIPLSLQRHIVSLSNFYAQIDTHLYRHTMRESFGSESTLKKLHNWIIFPALWKDIRIIYVLIYCW